MPYGNDLKIVDKLAQIYFAKVILFTKSAFCKESLVI